MKAEVTGKMSFNAYMVNKVLFELNDKYVKQGPISLDFDMKVKTTIDDTNTNMEILLQTFIFKEAEANNYPFEMQVDVSGKFTTNGSEGVDLDRFIPNGIAILFPYVRAIVSNYTANANVSPVILPTININAYLNRKKSDI